MKTGADSDESALFEERRHGAIVPHVPEAILNTAKIADQCNLELEFGKSILPEYSSLPEGKNATEYLRELCLNGLQERYGNTERWQDEAERASWSD